MDYLKVLEILDIKFYSMLEDTKNCATVGFITNICFNKVGFL